MRKKIFSLFVAALLCAATYASAHAAKIKSVSHDAVTELTMTKLEAFAGNGTFYYHLSTEDEAWSFHFLIIDNGRSDEEDIETGRTYTYVSCNPATQARDLALLDAKYKVTKVQPVDMFPHTQHMENVVQLELKKS